MRYAYRNIIKKPLRSILLVLSLMALITALLVTTSSREFMTQYFLGDLQSQYQDLDLKASVGTAGNARYFTLRTLNDHQDKEKYIKDVIPFFEMDTLVEVGAEKVYVKTMSSSISSLRKVSSVHPERLELTADQVMITQSMADAYLLNRGDVLTMHLGQSEKSYQIVDIILDQGLMTGHRIYLNKQYSLSVFLSALNPALSGLPEIFLTQLYNTLYIDIQDGQTPSSVMQYMHGLPGYSNLLIEETINLDEINEMIDRNMAIFSVVFVIVICAILLVMTTTLMVYFEDQKKMVAIIDLLGGRYLFSLGIILLEFFFFFIISTWMSIGIAQAIITYGLRLVGSSSIYTLESSTIIITISIALVLLIGVSIYDHVHMKRTSSIVEVNEHIQKDPISFFMYGLISVSSLSLYWIADWVNLGEYAVFMRVAAIGILMFSIPFLLIRILVHFPAKNELFLHLKMLIHQRSFRHYASVLLLSFLSIFLLVLSNTHMEYRFHSHRSEYKVDYILSNFITGYDETTLEIQAMPEVENADPVQIYENIYLPDYDDSLLMTVSITPSKIDTYFDLSLTDSSLHALHESYPVIILPKRYQMLYHLEVGNTIIANIHPDFAHVEFVIGGFFEKYIANLAFTNLSLIFLEADIGISSIFVNSRHDSQLLYQTLISLYSQHLVYVFDYQSLIESTVTNMERATAYITVILSAIILCFILSVINHSLLLLIQMRKNDARMFILGLSKKRMIRLMIFESIWLFVILLIGSLLGFYLFALELTELILWSGEYENVRISESTIPIGIILIIIVFIWTRLVYIVKLLNIQTSNVLRTYE